MHVNCVLVHVRHQLNLRLGVEVRGWGEGGHSGEKKAARMKVRIVDTLGSVKSFVIGC